MADAGEHKTRVNHLDSIGSLLQEEVKNRVFLKLDSRYADYFTEYSNCIGIDFRILKYLPIV